MISKYDLISVAFYLFFICGVGLSYARKSKTKAKSVLGTLPPKL